jgi:hypothetical protein
MSMAYRPHSADEARNPGSRQERAPVLQWIGLLLPAATFFAHLQIGYVLVPWSCTTHQDIWVHVVGIASVLLAAFGTLAAWRTWMRGGRESPGEGEGSLPRTRFLGAVGVGMGIIFTLILFAQWIAAFFIGVCQ